MPGKTRISSADPFEMVLRPPPNESREQKMAREERERQAREVSNRIDKMIEAEKVALKKIKKPVKVLLLGQSYSGKSTTLKNIQMQYGSKEWIQERPSWMIVVLLNLLRGINTILEVLDEHRATFNDLTVSNIYSSDSERVHSLEAKLKPLKQMQEDLEFRLGSAATENVDDGEIPQTSARPSQPTVTKSEFSVNSNFALKRIRRIKSRANNSRSYFAKDAFDTVASYKRNIQDLLELQFVKDLLESEDQFLDDSALYFVNNLKRVLAQSYSPSDEDVLHCRLRTTSVQAHAFKIGGEQREEWIFYDFNGARSCRSSWLSYFEDVNAVIFVAPIDVFDEFDVDGVNKLQDSIHLWRAIVSSKLLADVQLILLLNKCDLLERKLLKGSSVKKFFPSYGKDNSPRSVQSFFRSIFKEIMMQFSPKLPREFVWHFTSVVDKKSTSKTLSAIEEVITRQHFRQSGII